MTVSDPSGVSLSVDDGVAFVTFDLQGEKVNKLSRAVMERLGAILDELSQPSSLRGAIFTSSKGGVFLAGADLSEIRTVSAADEAEAAAAAGQAIMDRIEALPFPVVAAIGGICLGGGTEIALACRGRIGTDHPKFQIGLPEVNLGILPAWGGTTRLPRLVGLRSALDLALTGRSIDARKAANIGLLDRAVPHGQLRSQALRLVEELGRVARGRTRRRRRSIGEWALEGNPLGRWVLFRQARKRVLSQTKGHYPAPLAVVEVMRKGRSSRERSFEMERTYLRDLLPGDVSKSLVHLFFLSEAAKKSPGVDARAHGNVAPVKLETAGLLGAGTMGGGIARLLASRDLPVRLKDVSPEALGAGLSAARSLFEERRKRRRMSARDVDRRMALIAPTLDYSGFGRLDLVLEAIVEDMEIKKRVFRELEPLVPEGCIVASNTSTLSVSEMQAVLERPGRFAGFHFFNPVDRMPLVEVIRGVATDDRTTASLVALAKRLGKTPVVVKDGPGFLVNRILGPYLNEASYLLLETADAASVDRAFVSFGMPMGPLRLLDEVGIDVAQKAGRVLARAFAERVEASGILDRLVERGRLGKKKGIGFYRYDGGRVLVDPDLPSVVDARRGALDPSAAIERGIGLMVAEACRCLDDGIVGTPGELDLAMVMGTGFPPFRGGLLRHADRYGLTRIVDELETWAARKGSRFTPPPSLVDRARAGRGFY
jgi:3-hydroxyacyl-CoA dehydrogenase / enoyl-CoA hydratase / 3-hydroxybutyryl-CoA epimerase